MSEGRVSYPLKNDRWTNSRTKRTRRKNTQLFRHKRRLTVNCIGHIFAHIVLPAHGRIRECVRMLCEEENGACFSPPTRLVSERPISSLALLNKGKQNTFVVRSPSLCLVLFLVSSSSDFAGVHSRRPASRSFSSLAIVVVLYSMSADYSPIVHTVRLNSRHKQARSYLSYCLFVYIT